MFRKLCAYNLWAPKQIMLSDRVTPVDTAQGHLVYVQTFPGTAQLQGTTKCLE